MDTAWIEGFDELSQLEPSVREIIGAQSSIVTVAKDTIIFGPGKAAENLLLVLDGTVRVQQLSEAGREIVLYRVHGGQSCVMTTACLLTHEEYSAEGIAETDIRAVAVPRTVFDTLISQSEVFRKFVFSAYSRRITDLFLVIEEIAFQRMDIRLAQKLLELADDNLLVKATHQKLAAELGTAREVVSRQLQEFQRRNWVSQTRGAIALTHKSGIARLAASDRS